MLNLFYFLKEKLNLEFFCSRQSLSDTPQMLLESLVDEANNNDKHKIGIVTDNSCMNITGYLCRTHNASHMRMWFIRTVQSISVLYTLFRSVCIRVLSNETAEHAFCQTMIKWAYLEKGNKRKQNE